MHSFYDDPGLIAAETAKGRHRELIGGLWDEMGRLQFDFLRARGLTPASRLLDIGCGSLRLGALAIPWLNAGGYFGLDPNPELIAAGRAHELDDEGRIRAPESAFACNPDFDVSFVGAPVDMAIAQSVFTHLPLNHLRRCLTQLAPWMKPGGVFYATYFELPDDQPLHRPWTHSPGGVVTHDWQDPYHYRAADIAWAVGDSPWRHERIGGWNHPRAQFMAAFHRV